MIPYIAAPSLHLGPLTLEPFGFFVAAGILLAARILGIKAKEQGLDPRPLADYTTWGVGTGLVVGHLVHLFLYHPEELARGPLQVFKVWDGLSSTGGLLGGVIAAKIFFAVRKISFRAYGDALALGVAPGWAVARLGCFVAHDHPGVHTNFFLALNFPDGPRHDLGLYDAIALATYAAILFALRKRGLMKDRLLPLLAILYGCSRFGFDFLRATDMSYVDARYLGLTPAQFGCILLWVYGIYGLVRPPPPVSAASPKLRAVS